MCYLSVYFMALWIICGSGGLSPVSTSLIIRSFERGVSVRQQRMCRWSHTHSLQ